MAVDQPVLARHAVDAPKRPAPPAGHTELFRFLQKLISSEPALSARLIQLANSAAFKPADRGPWLADWAATSALAFMALGAVPGEDRRYDRSCPNPSQTKRQFPVAPACPPPASP